ncbi:MAG: LysR family transcriptional regulator, partial [Myxococcaceae bacterium]
RLPSPHDIHYFIEVAETLNLSRAAEKLGVRQPTLSLAMRRLEDALAVQLLVRSKTGVQLTRAGRRFLAKSRLLLEQWNELRIRTHREETELSGRYTLGVHPSVGLTTLPHVLPPLLQTFPDIETHLVHDSSREITERVINFQIDFGLVVNPRRHPDLTILPLYSDEFALWVAREPSPLQALRGEQAVLICDPDLSQSQQVLQALAKRKLAFRRTVRSSNLELIAALTAAGAGIGLLPQRVAQRNSNLTMLSRSLPTIRDQHCLVFRTDAQRSTANRALVRWIRAQLATRMSER